MECCKKEVDSHNIEMNTEGNICFCFNHSKVELLDAIKTGTEQVILKDIKTKMKNPGCSCETSNPSGKCCLADVMGFIKYFKEK